MNVCSIYKITNSVNDKVYIGQTWFSVQERFRKHKHVSSNCVKLVKAINKHGKDNFRAELITICSTQNVADYLEMLFIKQFDSIQNGYNVLIGGETGGRKGTKHSKETITKLSKAAKGRSVSDETRAKLLVANEGRVFSEEHKQKLSEAKKGKVFSEEHKSKLLGNHKGMTWTMIDGKRVWSNK